MKSTIPPKANILGDLRAEYDHKMLDAAFYESPDYRSLIETGDRAVIVGRRGTGKSALFYRLKNHWSKAERTTVITIAPEDYETISLHGVLNPFKNRINLVRAAAKLSWRYALIIEIGCALRNHFKFSSLNGITTLITHTRDWNKQTGSVTSKMREKIAPLFPETANPDLLIGELANKLQINKLAEELQIALSELKQKIYILIDRLDEGYEANELGIGLVDGFLHASIEINRAFPNVKAFMFIRDNIFRTIAKYDADYSRQIEGQVIRLHWDEYHLLNLIANRIRVAFNLTDESSLDIWNQKTCRQLSGRDGFRHCLRLTLYRPRDLLVLMNNAFYHAFQHGQEAIHEGNIENSAKEISESRFADLIKEYSSIFPGLEKLTGAFANGQGLWSSPEIASLLTNVATAIDLSPEETQHFAIIGLPDGGIQALYSIGFLGIKDPVAARFRFCHDGNQTKLETNDKAEYLVHPCYWRALNIHGSDLNSDATEEVPPAITEIHDEFDIEVSSKTPEIRKHRIGQIIAALQQIPNGIDGAQKFEEWCHQAITILFAAGLSNIEQKPNKDATQRRDIVARNQAKTDAWKRILTDYGARQVLFEVKNYSDLGPTEYRQMISYLVRDYGTIGFIITREQDEALRKDKDLTWVKEIYFEHKKLVVKLTGTWLAKYLSKARNPQKHDAADKALGGLLDTYQRLYLSLKK